MIPVVETERLRLRAPCEADLPVDIAFSSSERCQYVGGKSTDFECWNFLARKLGHWHLRGYGFWAIEDKNTREYYGTCGVAFRPDHTEPEFGWMLMNPSAEGKGIAHEAAIAARAYIYENTDLDNLRSTMHPENTRSIALAERLGAKFEYAGNVPPYGECVTYRHPSKQELS